MLHLQGKYFFIEHGIWLAAALAHEMTGLVTVKLSNGAEEVEEVLAVHSIKLSHESSVDEDELRSETFSIDLSQLRFPCLGVLAMSIWSKSFKHLLSHVVLLIGMRLCHGLS